MYLSIQQWSTHFRTLWKIAVHLAVAGDVFGGVFLCCPFSPRDVLDEIWDLIESVSGGFPSYSFKCPYQFENISCFQTVLKHFRMLC